MIFYICFIYVLFQGYDTKKRLFLINRYTVNVDFLIFLLVSKHRKQTDLNTSAMISMILSLGLPKLVGIY